MAQHGADVPVLGCTDPYADNYNEDAVVDDGSCSGYPDNGDYVLSFDGVDDFVNIPNSDLLNFSSGEDYSIQVNFKSNFSGQLSVAQGILAKAYGGPFGGWQIFITPENNNPLLFNANHGNENGGSYLYGPTSTNIMMANGIILQLLMKVLLIKQTLL